MNQTLNISVERFTSATPPKRHKPKRKCEGPGPTHYVTMYTTRQRSGEPGRNVDQRLLCNSCVEKLADEIVEKAQAEQKEREARRVLRQASAYLTRLQEVRKACGVTQKKLARAAYVSDQHLSDLERCKKKASLELASSLARALGVEVKELRG